MILLTSNILVEKVQILNNVISVIGIRGHNIQD